MTWTFLQLCRSHFDSQCEGKSLNEEAQYQYFSMWMAFGLLKLVKKDLFVQNSHDKLTTL